MKKWRIAIYSLNETPNFFLNNYNDLDHTNILCKCIWCLWEESIQNAWVKKCIWCVNTNSYISVHVYVLSRYINTHRYDMPVWIRLLNVKGPYEKWLWFSCKLNYCVIGIYTNIHVLIICPYCKEYYRHCITTFLELLQKSTLTAVPFYVQMRIKICTIIGFDVLTQVNELDNRSWF